MTLFVARQRSSEMNKASSRSAARALALSER
jgi:hypothetical protein